jgi:hypothetical protein
MKKAARIIGLIIVSIVAALYLFIIVGSLLEGEPLSLDFESLGMAILSSLTVISAIVSWVKVRIGVWMVLGVGVLFTIFALVTAGSNYFMAVIFAGGPQIIGGLLMLIGMKDQKSLKS